jgi:hypothetical protein
VVEQQRVLVVLAVKWWELKMVFDVEYDVVMKSKLVVN